MTEENYEYRTSQIMLRNELPGDGKWSIPIIPKFQIRDGDFDDLLLIGFDRAKTDDEKHRNRMVLFSCMTTSLSGYGNSLTLIWKNYRDIVQYCPRILACIWK